MHKHRLMEEIAELKSGSDELERRLRKQQRWEDVGRIRFKWSTLKGTVFVVVVVVAAAGAAAAVVDVWSSSST